MLKMKDISSGMVIPRRIVLFLVFICFLFWSSTALTNDQDFAALKALTDGWANIPEKWKGEDPCGDEWEGITCNNSRVVTISLSSMGLTGQLTGDLATLSELQILDLSYNKGLTGSIPSNIGDLSELTTLILLGCGFSGRIPDTVGSLKKLVYLSLNSNSFTGEIPASIGKLEHLYWLDLSDNKLSGSIPVSDGTKPGLDMLLRTKHFHFGINQLSGEIPPSLFSSEMLLIHVLFDNNNLTGRIPPTLGLVQTLQAVRFDRNELSGPVPSNLNNLTSVSELALSNNALTGPLPNLTGMNNLMSVDLSNNSFAATRFPAWFTTLRSLKTVIMERTGLVGQLPAEFFNIDSLQTVKLKNNQLNGSLDIRGRYTRQLELIDLENNSIDNVDVVLGNNFTLMLTDNPYCQRGLVKSPYCSSKLQETSYSTPVFCVTYKCADDQMSSSNCKCAYPYTGTLILRAPSFSAFGNDAYFNELQKSLLGSFVNFSLPVDAVSLSDVSLDTFGYVSMHLAFFPAGQNYFNRTAVLKLGFVFSNQSYEPPKIFKPYVFHADIYTHFEESDLCITGNKSSTHTIAIIGAVIGVVILLLLLVCAGFYAHYQKKRANKAKQQANPFVSWDSHGTSGDVPKLKGSRFFTFVELQKCTNSFSEANHIGSGGYGKVYRGVLTDGQIVAIKRSQQGSMQGSREFKNEIELLSRVHHKNLVKLIGFCFDHGEQMLIYEFIPNGTLLDSLSGRSGIQLDWIRRLKVALGSARGLQYLHELADPPIIHRDIKSTNILLDEHLNAKVADFGLSRLYGDADKGYVTTQVKGTMGYLDPEYFQTNQLTEKSDIFSFGVVLLEMITASKPIQQGQFIVKQIKETVDKSKELYNLCNIIDPLLRSSTIALVGFDRFMDLALKCVEEFGVDRPATGEVVKELENIMQMAGMNPDADSTTTSQSYEGSSTGQSFNHPYSGDSLVR
ncbi:leucine-rich repeat receptor protein kinase HPCA1-like isoform X2 [Amaranthus tricolor]|uniref:leucine-rich repeat receptor protein kinase HPCA1-like isoform X2 n=1 Tax=Amaranthus tricolor TaxID=29722 RepID=UPI00258F576A|nr:leucine-rich repeat receptor protein kinase HPCA1-like isoform X2 [Amaranthus tricolor]